MANDPLLLVFAQPGSSRGARDKWESFNRCFEPPLALDFSIDNSRELR